VLTFTHPLTQVGVLLISGLFSAFYFSLTTELPHTPLKTHISKKMGVFFLTAFFLILFTLPVIRSLTSSSLIQLADGFYRAGALVFGGGHVVLPLLEAEVVPTGQVSKEMFMAGYGLAQAVPGPLFTFSAYLGALSDQPMTGAVICLVSIFLPSFLLVCGVLPFWEKVRTYPHLRKAMLGINASVVGILLAALYQPVWMSAIFSARDFALATVGFVMLEFWRLPSWLVVVTSVIVSLFIY
jgi:chromate transporter